MCENSYDKFEFVTHVVNIQVTDYIYTHMNHKKLKETETLVVKNGKDDTIDLFFDDEDISKKSFEKIHDVMNRQFNKKKRIIISRLVKELESIADKEYMKLMVQNHD